MVVEAGELPADRLLWYAASLAQVSQHVLAAAVVRAALRRGCQLALPSDASEQAGEGNRGIVAGHAVAVGKASWCGIDAMAEMPGWVKAARRRARLDGALTVFVTIDSVPAGVLILDDPIRPDAARTIRALREGG